MSRITRESSIYLQYLARANKSQLKTLLCDAATSDLLAVLEIIKNYKLGNLKRQERFDKRKNLIGTLADKSVPLKRKRLILCSSSLYRNVVQAIVAIWASS